MSGADTAASAMIEAKAVGGLRTGATAAMDVAKHNLARALAAFEKVLEPSKLGSVLLRTGKILGHPVFLDALVIIGAAIKVVTYYEHSPMTTERWKKVGAVVHGVVAGLIMKSLPIAVLDMVLAAARNETARPAFPSWCAA